MPSHDGKPVQCNDAYYGYLPGLVDFCLGLRAWHAGHYRSGMDFLTLAAGWGSKGAQLTLGMIHYNGRHVRVDRALGIAWLKLADERHNDPRIDAIAKAVVKWATPAERQRGQQLFETMLAKYGDMVATARAWGQFEHQVRRAAYSRSGSLAAMTTRSCIFMPAEEAGDRGFDLAATPPVEQSNALKPSVSYRAQHPRVDASGVCVPMAQFDQGAQQLSQVYFKGWEGHVSVGALQEVPATSAPAH